MAAKQMRCPICDRPVKNAQDLGLHIGRAKTMSPNGRHGRSRQFRNVKATGKPRGMK